MLNVVPNPGQSLGITQPLIKSNFNTIDTAFSINHISYQDGTGNQGFHNFIQLPTATPTRTTMVTSQVALYANTGTKSGVPELYFQRNNLGANNGYAITESYNSSGNGWTILPSGVIMKWGNQNIGGNPSGTTYTFPVGANYKAFTNIFSIQICMGYNGNSGAYDQSISVSTFTPPTPTGFTLTWSSGTYNSNTSVYYLAIGN